MRNEISPFLISRNSRNSAKQFLFRIIFVFRENKKIDEIDNPSLQPLVRYCPAAYSCTQCTGAATGAADVAAACCFFLLGLRTAAAS